MKQATILLVDDHERTVISVARGLGRIFSNVRTATTPEQAEAILLVEPVGFILCDHNLGKGVPTGCDLIPGWRSRFPSIRRAVLFSGSQPELIKLPPAVDRFLAKPASLDEIAEAFGVED